MIKVNLVPPEILAKSRQRQLAFQATVVGSLFLAALATVSFNHWYGKYDLEQELAEKEKQLKDLDRVVKQVEELEAAANAVRTRLGVVENLLLGRAYYPIFMSEFARTVPSGVKVNSMSTAQPSPGSLRLTISAVANSNEDIVTWAKTLEKNPKFSLVELGPVSTAGLFSNFSITMTYVGN